MTAGSLTRSMPSSRWPPSPSRSAEPAQEPAAVAGREVAQRAAEEAHEALPVGLGQPVEVALEVADEAVDAQARVLLDQPAGAGPQRALGDVDRHVAAQPAGVGHRVEQHAGLVGRARAQLDELARAGQLDDLGGARLEDRALGPRRVVLGQLADAVEELRAAGVVEVLGRELLERPGQAVEHVLGQGALGAVGEDAVDLDERPGDAGDRFHHASLTSRRPEKICRRWGRSQLRNVGEATPGAVAQDPPRRTRWPRPKKTSEYSR